VLAFVKSLRFYVVIQIQCTLPIKTHHTHLHLLQRNTAEYPPTISFTQGLLANHEFGHHDHTVLELWRSNPKTIEEQNKGEELQTVNQHPAGTRGREARKSACLPLQLLSHLDAWEHAEKRSSRRSAHAPSTTCVFRLHVCMCVHCLFV